VNPSAKSRKRIFAENFTAVVPSGATTGPLLVTVGGISSNPVSFTVGTGTMMGTVTNASGGSGVSGALVELLQSNLVVTSTTSGASGSYSVTNFAPGTYDVRISATGFGTVLQLNQVVATGTSATVNASLPSPGTDSGRVTNANGGAAISGATVSALQGADIASSTITNSSGNFTLSNLSAGTYSVQASAPGFAPVTTTGIRVTATTTTTTNFSLAGQSTISYDYDPLGRLAGVVDSQNGAAVYNYDAVGNVTSIARPAVSQVSIISFSPQS
jgi:YD repeat-containing protein